MSRFTSTRRSRPDVGSREDDTRLVADMLGSRTAELNGTFVGGGGDWLLIGSDGWARLDVRDGAVLYLTYHGVLELTETVTAATQTMAEETDFEDQYFRITPRLETGDERYGWVNRTVLVGRGRLIPGGAAYEVYRVT